MRQDGRTRSSGLLSIRRHVGQENALAGSPRLGRSTGLRRLRSCCPSQLCTCLFVMQLQAQITEPCAPSELIEAIMWMRPAACGCKHSWLLGVLPAHSQPGDCSRAAFARVRSPVPIVLHKLKRACAPPPLTLPVAERASASLGATEQPARTSTGAMSSALPPASFP